MSSAKIILLSLTLTAVFSCSHLSHEEANIKPSEFAKLAYDSGAQVLDVRTIGEFRSGHLKGALQADWLDQNQFAERINYLDKDKPLVVYCMSGKRGLEAAEFLRGEGFTNVKNLDGGLIAWKTSGKKLVECKPHGKETPTEEYAKLINSAPQVIVGFNAAWSPPCKKMESILSDFENTQTGQVKVISMDGSTESKLMLNLNVEALPTYILYRQGTEFSRKQGVLTTADLADWVAVKASDEKQIDSNRTIGQIARKQSSKH
ncbi:rhodanese-like domain-containing protein [Pollutibacter soli]|uniref:rhodanese-like domain-containing protein n=1 Tax=Pollutibacter soli TaxID=3034157 RepID=UPI0030136603